MHWENVASNRWLACNCNDFWYNYRINLDSKIQSKNQNSPYGLVYFLCFKFTRLNLFGNCTQFRAIKATNLYSLSSNWFLMWIISPSYLMEKILLEIVIFQRRNSLIKYIALTIFMRPLLELNQQGQEMIWNICVIKTTIAYHVYNTKTEI